jgi:hypothetical protein
MIPYRGEEYYQKRYKENLEKAIELYKRAIFQDPAYVPSYNNLACALILRARGGDPYEAIGKLKDAIILEPARPDTLNNLGVAFYYAENPAKAKEYFLEAHRIDPAYDLPLFNLGRLALEMGGKKEGRKYLSQYLKLDTTSLWRVTARELIGQKSYLKPSWKRMFARPEENILGLKTRASDEMLPGQWGEPKTDEIALDGDPYLVRIFPNQMMTVSRYDQVGLIVTLNGFAGKTAGDVGMGCSKKDVLSRYGAPFSTLDSSQGVTLVYHHPHVAFNFREGRLVSWILF